MRIVPRYDEESFVSATIAFYLLAIYRRNPQTVLNDRVWLTCQAVLINGTASQRLTMARWLAPCFSERTVERLVMIGVDKQQLIARFVRNIKSVPQKSVVEDLALYVLAGHLLIAKHQGNTLMSCEMLINYAVSQKKSVFLLLLSALLDNWATVIVAGGKRAQFKVVN